MDAKETKDLLTEARRQAHQRGPFDFFGETGMDQLATYALVSSSGGDPVNQALDVANTMANIQTGYELARLLGFAEIKDEA